MKNIIVCIEPRRDYQPKTDPDKNYSWICPQCNGMVHGDSRKDSLFEIRHDPICIDCRCKNGEFRLNGLNFERVNKGQVALALTGKGGAA